MPQIAQQDYLKIYVPDGIDTVTNDKQAKAKILELYQKGLLADALIVQDEKSFARILSAYGATDGDPLYVSYFNGESIIDLEIATD